MLKRHTSHEKRFFKNLLVNGMSDEDASGRSDLSEEPSQVSEVSVKEEELPFVVIVTWNVTSRSIRPFNYTRAAQLSMTSYYSISTPEGHHYKSVISELPAAGCGCV